MKYPHTILILLTALIYSAYGETNFVPPMPPYSPSPASEEGVLFQAQLDEAEAYAASLRPSPRVLMEDGLIIKWSNEAIEWHVEAPYYRVVWAPSLTNRIWVTVGSRVGGKLTHNKPEGFYRVIPAKRPTLPPTYPASGIPTNSASQVSVRTNAVLNTGYTRRDGGFRK